MKKKKVKSKGPIEFSKYVFPKNVQWLHDFDYLHKLPPKEREFMARFIREYINGNVRHGDPEALHNTSELVRDCFNRKNAQNRDLMSILNCTDRMDRLDEDRSSKMKPHLPFKSKINKKVGQG